MIICLCHRVSDRDIAQLAPHCGSFCDLQERTQVGTQCGACLPFAQACYDEAAPRVARSVSGIGMPPRPA
jgi:bacterioferritin-associated ferredoxin